MTHLLDLTDRPFRWRMGLKPLDPDAWILIDEHYERDLAEKRRLVRESHDDVIAVLPGTEDAAAEVLHALATHLVERSPDRFGRDAHALVAGDDSLHPIERAGLLVQEDLCLHTVVDGRLVLSAASLCFPTRWRLGDKIGRSLSVIHEPVPGYADVATGVDRVVGQLRVTRGVWRTNWSVMDDPALFQPTGHGRGVRAEGAEAITAADAGQRLWLRVERQTLRRFPEHDSVLFTIRVLQRSFAELGRRPDVAAWLAAAIRRLPTEVARYKSIAPFGEAAAAWLDVAAGGAPIP